MSIRKIVPVEEADWKIASVPAWVLPREPDWAFAAPSERPVTFLLFDEQHQVATQSISRRTVRRLENLAAVQALGQADFEFDPAAGRLRIHETAIWRRSAEGVYEKRSLARRESFLIRQREQQFEQQILHGRLSVVALLEDLRVGDAIDLAWTLEPHDPLPGLHFTTFCALAWSVPVGRTYFTLHLHPDFPVRWVLHLPHEGTAPQHTASSERADWWQERPALLEPEPNAPPWHWPFPMVDVTGWHSWGEVADFMAGLWAEAIGNGQEALAEEAGRLRVEGDLVATLHAAIRYVQAEVRYLAVDFGHGAGMLPNGAGTVLRRRFGDCKDKAVLLVALLRALGFEAWPVLVAAGWQKAVARVQPSPSAFSHAIVTFLAGGSRHFVDPTFLGQGGDLAHLLAPPYGCGLEVRAGATQLLLLPDRPLAELELTETFQLDRKQQDGSVEQVLRATAWMADDVRASVLRSGPAAFFKSRTEVLQRHFPGLVQGEGGGKVTDDAASNVIEMRAAHQLPTWGPAGKKPPAFFRYGAHGLFLGLETIEGPERRRQPWLLRFPLRVRHRVLVRGRGIGAMKREHHVVQGPGFRYVCDVTARRREVVFDYQWETTQLEVPPQQWAAYRSEREKAFQRAGANVPIRAVLGTPQWIAAALIGAVLFPLLAALHPSVSSPPQFARTPEPAQSYRQAVAAFQSGNYSVAEALFEKLRPTAGGGLDFQLMRADAALHLEHFSQAREAMAEARKLTRADPRLDLLEASLQQRTGHVAAALAHLEPALAGARDNELLLSAGASLAGQLGKPAEARKAFARCLELKPGDLNVRWRYGLLLWAAGEREVADAVVLGWAGGQRGLGADLEGTVADYLLATGRAQAAVAPALRAMDRAPGEVKPASRAAWAQAAAGDLDEGARLASRATERFPGEASAWGARAKISALRKDNEAAEAAFQRWLKLAPRDPAPRANYGHFLFTMGRLAEARSVLGEATHEFPRDGFAWLNYAEVLDALKDPAASLARAQADALLPPELRVSLVH